MKPNLAWILALGLSILTPGRIESQAPRAPTEADFWDGLYSRPDTRYTREANAFLVHAVERISRESLCSGKKALDLGMGEGRNAVFLAQAGFTVTGLDISRVAIEHAKALAKAKGVALDAVESDLFAYDYGSERFDLITLIYFNPAVKILDKLKKSVTPGGLILIEGQGYRHTGGGPPPSTRFTDNQLLRAFDDWRVVEYHDGVFPCDWNQGKPTHVVRILARKPAAK